MTTILWTCFYWAWVVLEVVIAAAREWQVPGTYIQSLRRWLPAGAEGNPSMFKGPSRKIGEFG